jgi:hypothetical protein
MNNQPDLDRIAEEAVGQLHASAPPDAVTENEDISLDEHTRRLATSAGAQASTPETTAGGQSPFWYVQVSTRHPPLTIPLISAQPTSLPTHA